MTSKEVITTLVKRYDEKTEAQGRVMRTLTLLGSEDSYFLGAVKRKCDHFGIHCDIFDYMPLSMNAVVIDRETYEGLEPAMNEYQDIDLMKKQHTGLSCTAEAVTTVLYNMTSLVGKTVTLVGRGHAVKGLAEALLGFDCTVTLCHSKTMDLPKATMDADILILATPYLSEDNGVCLGNHEFVIDLGNCISTVPAVKYLNSGATHYINNIGRLTVSILVNRLATKI